MQSRISQRQNGVMQEGGLHWGEGGVAVQWEGHYLLLNYLDQFLMGLLATFISIKNLSRYLEVFVVLVKT